MAVETDKAVGTLLVAAVLIACIGVIVAYTEGDLSGDVVGWKERAGLEQTSADANESAVNETFNATDSR